MAEALRYYRGIIFSATNRRLCAEKDDDRGRGRGGRSCGSRAVESAAREDQAAAGISDFRMGRRRGQRAVAHAEPGRHRVRRHVERRQRVRAARREQGRQSRSRHHHHQRIAEHAQRRRLPRRRAVRGRDQPRHSLRQHRVEARERRHARRSSPTSFRAIGITDGSSSDSAPTACCTSRSARRATCAIAAIRTPPSCA